MAAGQCISISTPKPQFQVGEKINVFISIKNVGTNEVRFACGNPLRVYDATVRKDGETIQPTLEAKNKIDGLKQSGGSLAVEILMPNEEDTEKNNDYHPYYPLSQVYTLSQPGRYKVQLTRELINPNSTTVEWLNVNSNEIEIIIKQ